MKYRKIWNYTRRFAYMQRVKCLAVLEVMWGEPRPIAPGVFRINPMNTSGRRLHNLTGLNRVYVTNACRECVSDANGKGTPDPRWLATNLQRLQYDLLLVCGVVAYRTYHECGYTPNCEVMFIKHPAARNWTKREMLETGDKIRQALRD